MAGFDFSEVMALEAVFGQATAKMVEQSDNAVRKAAFDVEAAGKSRAPVRTGFLRGSIGTTIRGGGAGGTSAEIGPTAHYGVYVEMGTRKMRAQPYMGPALKAVEPKFVQAIEQAVGNTLW